MWEMSGQSRLLVTSRIEAWAAFDRMARTVRAANPLDLDAVGWLQEARAVQAWLEDRAVAADGGLQLDASPGAGDDPDSGLLAVAWSGPWPASSPIVAATVDRILQRLSSNGLLYRYPETINDGLSGPDSPDLACSLWAVRALANLGRWDEAHERMEAVLGFCGPSGLLSETADPTAGELLGNLPSTAVSLAFIDAAVAVGAGPA
jgi:GH15 family glucan-1,4-alpha-glucosidase